MIKQLRQETGAGVQDCRKALEQNDGNYTAALHSLQEKSAAAAAKRSDRQASQGIIELYSHGNGRIGVMVEVNCETDFAARSTAFLTFAHELALQIAGASPLWVRDEDIPPDILQQEEGKVREMAWSQGKPDELIPRIVAGYLKKFMDQNVLIRQPSIRDDTRTISQLLAQVSGSLGENVIIRRFARWEIVT
ncbi:MAG TPA: elongation factor Ts, partial [Longilinea sp.]|nr:elongation factor Ts [Longilinea sp.]